MQHKYNPVLPSKIRFWHQFQWSKLRSGSIFFFLLLSDQQQGQSNVLEGSLETGFQQRNSVTQMMKCVQFTL